MIFSFHNGKMYRYVDPALDIKSFVAFALHRYKEQRGHRIPEPPTALSVMEFYFAIFSMIYSEHYFVFDVKFRLKIIFVFYQQVS